MAISTKVSASGRQSVDALLSGYRWAGGSVTWSAPDSRLDYAAGHLEKLTGLTKLNSLQLRAAEAALEAAGPDRGFSVEGFTNLKIDFISGGSGKGRITLANTADPSGAYAYYPGETSEGGDVFFGGLGKSPRPGNEDWQTILHELGHALGLKHGHESDTFGALPDNRDGAEWSVMTYHAHPGTNAIYTNETWGHSQTFMMLDIAALQHMYGADFTTNAGATTYSWKPGAGTTFVDGAAAISPGANRIFATIWDGGGKDTYDLSAYKSDVSIDLRPGEESRFSSAQTVRLDDDVKAAGNIYNALQYKGDARSLIENATGGSGSDRITGNTAANTLRGESGNDKLSGLSGDDLILGGSGHDTLDGGNGNDVLMGGTGRDTLVGNGGADVFRFHAGTSTSAATDRLVAGSGGAAFDNPGKVAGDVLDVSAIDANALVAGNQTFKWGGTAKAGTGYLWLAASGSDTVVRGNTDADSASEFRIDIADGGVRATHYTADDFLL